MKDTIQMPAASPKVQKVLLSLLQDSERVHFLIKTKWKPSPNIPTLWLAVTDRRIVLFSTLSAKSVFRSAVYCELNAAQSENSGRSVVILHTKQEIKDWRFYLADLVSSEMGLQCVQKINSGISHNKNLPQMTKVLQCVKVSNQKLRAARGLLLPRLMSGEIAV